MDRILLVSMSTGMLSFHYRITQNGTGTPTSEKDEMQLASLFSALYYVRSEMGSICDESNKHEISIHEQGQSAWTTGIISHRCGKFILAMQSKAFLFSKDFWNIIFSSLQQELSLAPLDKLDENKGKKAVQLIFQEGLSKSVNCLAKKLTFGSSYCLSCDLLMVATKSSLLSCSTERTKAIVCMRLNGVVCNNDSISNDEFSPRPKASELRSTVETPYETTSTQCHDVPIKNSSSFSSWCCFGSSSSVKAIARNSIHIDPLPTPPTANTSPPSSPSALIVITQEISPKSSSTGRPDIMPYVCRDDQPKLITQQLRFLQFSDWTEDAVGREKLRKVLFDLESNELSRTPETYYYLLNDDWEIEKAAVHCTVKDSKLSQSDINPPSPVTVSDETGKQLFPSTKLDDELQLESLEDDIDHLPNPPKDSKSSLPEHNLAAGVHSTTAYVPQKKYVLARNCEAISVFSIITVATNVQQRSWSFTYGINQGFVNDFHNYLSFCCNQNWLSDQFKENL